MWWLPYLVKCKDRRRLAECIIEVGTLNLDVTANAAHGCTGPGKSW